MVIRNILIYFMVLWVSWPAQATETKPVTVTTKKGDFTYYVEIANTSGTRAKGLMFRRSLPEDGGMFFIFPKPQFISMWMKNTYIPLDIIFFDEHRKVTGVIVGAEPESTESLYVPMKSQYVLELNTGEAAKMGVRVGDSVRYGE